MLLNSLAHNVLVWARAWMSAAQPKLKKYGILRLVRDVCGVSGFIETTERGEITGLVLNKGSAIARTFILAFQVLLGVPGIAIELGSTSGSSFPRDDTNPATSTESEPES